MLQKYKIYEFIENENIQCNCGDNSITAKSMKNVDSKLPKSKAIRKNTNFEWAELLF